MTNVVASRLLLVEYRLGGGDAVESTRDMLAERSARRVAREGQGGCGLL
jgi:hypothetical protein